MPSPLPPAASPTIYFVGVSTGKSSIMKVFPAWARHLGLTALISGIDLPIDDRPENYRAVVEFIKNDPLSLGALVTTHKLNLYKASRELFDHVGEDAAVLDEVSSISKRGTQLWAHAMDAITSGLSLQAILDEDYWRRTGAQLLLLGAGGSCLALTLHLHRRAEAGQDVPVRIVVTNHRPERLQEMQEVHKRIGMTIPIDYRLVHSAEANNEIVAGLPQYSVVVNGTGLGKDRPGSPLGKDARFPMNGIAWDFNYRGDLLFLAQARAQATNRNLSITDGWVYFIHGWTRVIADVFQIDIPTSGPVFETLSDIAHRAGAVDPAPVAQS